ncbi:family 16 glycoside hydrolase [Lacibacter sp. H375]|uniref:family 16 glycoside hydrolase n=1 Tax=Lacibacter sp. H375 TaxID=3133424 RepID=UPI0030BECBFE
MNRFVLSLVIFLSINSNAQTIKLESNKLEAVQVFMSMEKFMGSQVVKVIKDSSVKAVDEPTFVRIKDVDFSNGIIEVKVLSRLLKNASEFARGFIGIAFRINDNNTKFECIYLRPTNGRAIDQVRRNHSIQYYSYPDYKFDRLRKESPERYEAYADMELNKWITMRIEVNGTQAKLFLNNNQQPSLIVNDLKHGSTSSGGIALWVDVGTEGYFKDLKIIKK